MPARPSLVLLRLALAGFALLPAAALAVPGPAPQPATPPEPAVQRTVVDEVDTRVEELRVRGEVRRITVTPKNGGKAYEILPAPAGRDPSPTGPGAGKGATGQRVWNVLDF